MQLRKQILKMYYYILWKKIIKILDKKLEIIKPIKFFFIYLTMKKRKSVQVT